MRIFISYSSKDRIFAELLQLYLEESGIATWRDAVDIAPGDRFDNAIRDAIIHQCTHMIVVKSKNAHDSPYVAREAQLAQDNHKKLIFVKIKGTRQEPFLQEVLQHNVDLTNGSVAEHMNQLLRELREDMRKEQIPSTTPVAEAKPTQFEHLLAFCNDRTNAHEPFTISDVLQVLVEQDQISATERMQLEQKIALNHSKTRESR